MSDKFAKMMFFTCRNIKFILIKTKYYRQNLFEKIKIIIQKTKKKTGNSIFGNMPAKPNACVVIGLQIF